MEYGLGKLVLILYSTNVLDFIISGVFVLVTMLIVCINLYLCFKHTKPNAY